MELTYTRETKAYYLEETDEIEYDGYEYTFEPEDKKVLDVLCELVINDTKGGYELDGEERKLTKKIVRRMIEDFDLQEQLQEEYYEDLKEYFADEALASERGY